MTLYVVGLEVAVEARTQTCRRGQGAFRDGDDISSHMTLKWLYKGVIRATQLATLSSTRSDIITTSSARAFLWMLSRLTAATFQTVSSSLRPGFE